MFIDGVNRIFFISEQDSGCKSFAASALYMSSAVSCCGKMWQFLSIPDDNDVYPDAATMISENLKSSELFDSLRPVTVLSGTAAGFPDRINLMLRVENKWCGRVELTNIAGRSAESSKIVRSPAIAVILDSSRIAANDTEYISVYRNRMDHLLKKADADAKVHFVMTKADLVEEALKEKDFQGLYIRFSSNCRVLTEICKKYGLEYEGYCTSAANKETSKVYGTDGRVKKDADIVPYNTSETLISVILDSARIMQRSIWKDIRTYNKRIAIRRSVFNSRKKRAELEIDYSRKKLCEAIKAVYPSDNLLSIVSASEKGE